VFANLSTLIIREIYYGGCQAVAGGTYQKDQYIEVYNNSTQTQYLDSLMVGAINPYNSTTNNSWAGKDTIAVPPLGLFMVPGDGTTYPLEPGESAVFTINAVDHTSLATSALKLNKAHFALYHTMFKNQNEPDPSVTTMERVAPHTLGTPNSYTLSVSSPAVVIYRIPNLPSYFANLETWQKIEPGKGENSTKFYHIDKSWIIDGVECVARAADAVKRLPVDVDVSYTLLSETFKGNCVTRKVQKKLPSGQKIYQDTNNSAEDFITDVPANPTLRP
jgi:hypothetical protein